MTQDEECNLNEEQRKASGISDWIELRRIGKEIGNQRLGVR